MKKILILQLLCIVALQITNAQPAQLKFDHFSIKEGLPEPLIQFIKQDDQGYIWMGTQNGLVRYDGYKPRVYRLGITKKGMSQSSVLLSMVEDENKNLWFSTGLMGLFKYNRSSDSFTQYKYPTSDTKQIVDPYFLFADKKGNLWGYNSNFITGQCNIVKFDQKKKQFNYFGKIQNGPGYMQYGLGLNTGMPYSLFQSASPGQKIWMGTVNGLFLYNETDHKFHPWFTAADASKQRSIYNIYEAPSEPGILWYNVFDHLSKKYLFERMDTRNKSFKDYGAGTGLIAPNDTISNIYEDSRRRLWFASRNGLLLFDRKKETFTRYTPADTDKEINKNQVYEIEEAKNGKLWLRCGKGLLNFDPVTHIFHRYIASRDPSSLNSDQINHLLIDRSGTLWASGFFAGVNILNNITSAFTIYKDKTTEGLSAGYGLTSSGGYIWFAAARGIYKLKPGSDKYIQVYQSKKTDGLLSAICIGNDGTIYFSNTHGLDIFNPERQTLQVYTAKPADSAALSSNNIITIIQDHTGTIWIGTGDKGICSFNPRNHRFTRYPYVINNGRQQSGDKLGDADAEVVYEDVQGVIWVGTNQGGLNRFDRKTGKFKSYLFEGDNWVKIITSIFQDKTGRLWVGSYLQGLYEFDPKTGHYVRCFDEENGLLLDAPNELSEDDKGFLWIASQKGLTRLRTVDMTLKNYILDAILPEKEFGYSPNLSAGGGLMMIPLNDAIAVFNPRDLDGNPYPPIVHIEKVSYNDPASNSDSVTNRFCYGISQLVLPHNQNRVTFNYVALHFTNPAGNQYKYWLDGYDRHLIDARTQRSATYTNLAPGTYTFHVTAANSDGVWNNTGDSFIIVINPPWWQTWWAWALWVVLFISAVYAFIAYRSRKLLHDKKILEHKVHVRTEEVMQQKEEIESQRDNLEKAFSELKITQNQLIQSEKMASLGELTAGIAHEIQNPLNFVNNFSEVSAELTQELKEELRSGHTEDAIAIADDLEQNLGKIQHHGKRADAIVKGMLQHSQSGSGTKEPTNINTLADEYMRLAYHGLRVKDKSFNAEMVTRFDEKLPLINVIPQDIGRVMLNLFNNAFYAVNQKQKTASADYKPEVTVTTSVENGRVVIKVKDNGVGIPDAIKEKIMQPFFTTKPTGEGTGLGLSLTYDMVVKGHGGTIAVETAEGAYTEFTITLPIS